MFIEDLLNKAYQYVIIARLKSDPVERPFTQYGPMSGGRFLVISRESETPRRFYNAIL